LIISIFFLIWLIFFLFHQTKPCYCRLFAWSQLDFSAIPVSISGWSFFKILDFKVAKWAVSSLTHYSNPFQVDMCISKFIIQILHMIQNVQEGKRYQKKETSNF